MDSEERDPNPSEAGTGRDVGSGYPEEQPGGASGGSEGSGSGGTGEADERSPDSKTGSDSDAGTATGNPDAAG
jgi:hypothetical protein